MKTMIPMEHQIEMQNFRIKKFRPQQEDEASRQQISNLQEQILGYQQVILEQTKVMMERLQALKEQ